MITDDPGSLDTGGRGRQYASTYVCMYLRALLETGKLQSCRVRCDEINAGEDLGVAETPVEMLPIHPLKWSMRRPICPKPFLLRFLCSFSLLLQEAECESSVPGGSCVASKLLGSNTHTHTYTQAVVGSVFLLIL